MKFRDFLKLNEERFVIGNKEVFKLPTLIKGEHDHSVSKNSIRRMNLDTNMLKKASEVLEYIKCACLDYLAGNDRMLLIRKRDKNNITFRFLGMNINSERDMHHAVEYILKYLQPSDFLIDYEEPNSHGKWFYEFKIKDFRNDANFMEHFEDITLNAIPRNDVDFYLKFSFRYCLNLHQNPNPRDYEEDIPYLKRSKDGYIYLARNFTVALDNVSFHFFQ